MKFIKSIVAALVLSASMVGAASASTVDFNIPDAGHIVWGGESLAFVASDDGSVSQYHATGIRNEIINGQHVDFMSFAANTEAGKGIVLAHNVDAKFTKIYVGKNGNIIATWIVDDRYAEYSK